jgi:DNA modification methylase
MMNTRRNRGVRASVLGDVWLLGNHRLICGDSTNAEDVDRVLNGVKPHLCVTDPPYGVEYDPAWRELLRDSGAMVQEFVAEVQTKGEWSLLFLGGRRSCDPAWTRTRTVLDWLRTHWYYTIGDSDVF